MSTSLPPCGLYRTASAIAGIPADRLVYFHNHGDPGPGVYFPEKWNHNRAKFAANGSTLPTGFDPRALKPLPAEGFYAVKTEFYCCEKKCVQYQPGQLVQLGYNGAGRALVFIPELASGALELPDRGTLIDDAALSKLSPLRVPERKGDIAMPRGIIVH